MYKNNVCSNVSLFIVHQARQARIPDVTFVFWKDDKYFAKKKERKKAKTKNPTNKGTNKQGPV